MDASSEHSDWCAEYHSRLFGIEGSVVLNDRASKFWMFLCFEIQNAKPPELPGAGRFRIRTGNLAMC